MTPGRKQEALGRGVWTAGGSCKAPVVSVASEAPVGTGPGSWAAAVCAQGGCARGETWALARWGKPDSRPRAPATARQAPFSVRLGSSSGPAAAGPQPARGLPFLPEPPTGAAQDALAPSEREPRSLADPCTVWRLFCWSAEGGHTAA